MKNLIISLIFAVIVVLSFGFISQGSPDEQNRKSCPFLEKMKNHTECPYLSGSESTKSECPFLRGKKSGCPLMESEAKEKGSGACPYSGLKENRKLIEDQKVQQFQVKYS